MCGFPIRRESGAGNRIPGDFFAFFLGRARKKVPLRHERAKKEQTLVGDRHDIKPTVKWPGHVLRPLGRAGRSLAPRRPARSRGSFTVSAGCDPRQITVRLIVRVAVSPEPPPAKGCNLRFCPRWPRAITYNLTVRLFFIRVGCPGDRPECARVAGLPWGGVRPAR